MLKPSFLPPVALARESQHDHLSPLLLSDKRTQTLSQAQQMEMNHPSSRYSYEPVLRWDPEVEDYFNKAYGPDHFARISKALTYFNLSYQFLFWCNHWFAFLFVIVCIPIRVSLLICTFPHIWWQYGSLVFWGFRAVFLVFWALFLSHYVFFIPLVTNLTKMPHFSS